MANAAQPSTATPMSPPPQQRIVLLVEDSDDDAFFFERALKEAGVEKAPVRLVDGGAAIAYLERASAGSKDLSQTHILFLDLKLPVLSGFEVLKWIRDHRVSIEVLVLSGSSLDLDMEAARRLGASDYLVKPISAAELKQRLGCGTQAPLPGC
jgi:CheY-like chemotaxis protein